MSTRLISKFSSAAARLPTNTATSAPGIALSCLGRSRFHSTSDTIVITPISAARWCVSMPNGNRLRNASGIVPRLSRPVFFGLSSSITWNWLAKISTPMPASIPRITAGETALNHWPSLSRPATSWMKPAMSTSAPSAFSPCVFTMS